MPRLLNSFTTTILRWAGLFSPAVMVGLNVSFCTLVNVNCLLPKEIAQHFDRTQHRGSKTPAIDYFKYFPTLRFLWTKL